MFDQACLQYRIWSFSHQRQLPQIPVLRTLSCRYGNSYFHGKMSHTFRGLFHSRQVQAIPRSGHQIFEPPLCPTAFLMPLSQNSDLASNFDDDALPLAILYPR